MDFEAVRIQIVAIVGSVALLAFIIDLLRKRQLREEYSLLWLFGGVAFLVLAVFRGLLEQFAGLVGIAYPPAALFLALIMGAYLMLLHFSLVFSRMADRYTAIVQELALLRLEVDRLRGIGGVSEPVESSLDG